MKSNYKALYELVERIDERNSDGSVTDLLGVSIDKCFIKSVANTNGTDLTKYKVTTLQYAMVKQSNVKLAHRKYIG